MHSRPVTRPSVGAIGIGRGLVGHLPAVDFRRFSVRRGSAVVDRIVRLDGAARDAPDEDRKPCRECHLPAGGTAANGRVRRSISFARIHGSVG